MRRSVTFVFAILALALPAAAQSPDAAEVLKELGFPSDAKQDLIAGKFVRTGVKSTSDRELTSGMAFLVKVPPRQLVDELEGQLLLEIDPNVKAHGKIEGEGSPVQLAGLKLSADQVKAYAGAEAGSKLNLSKQEIAAFRQLEGKPAAQVEKQVKESLLARYRAYREKGLEGIAPYERGGGDQTLAAGDLRRASEAAQKTLKRIAPGFYEVLVGYPKGRDGVTELFNWQSYEAHGEPIFLLTHAFMMDQGDAVVVCQRQFYASGSYNAEQALAAFLPVTKGTLVVYVNRTSTDQVAGFGGGTKRSLGGRVLSSQLEGLFQKLQTAAPK